MGIRKATLSCDLYQGAFSGEVVFAFRTAQDQEYEGIAPKQYAEPKEGLDIDQPRPGRVSVRMIRNGGNTARIAIPDGETVEVPASAVST